MEIIKTKYAIREKTTKKYITMDNDFYYFGELCDEIENAYLWVDDEDATDCIKGRLGNRTDIFEVLKIVVIYKL